MKMLIVMIGISAVLLGCASINNSNYADFVDENGKPISSSGHAMSGIVVSYDIDRELSDNYFSLIQMTFENTSDDWVRIKDLKIDFNDDALNPTVLIIGGKDLVAWSESIHQKKAIENYNTNLFLGSIAAVGAATAAGSSKSSSKTIGATAMLGALTVSGISDVKSKLNSLEYARLYPDTHLLAGEINVPPGLFQKKWIVLNSKKPISLMRVIGKTSTDKKIDFVVKLAPPKGFY